MSAWRWGLPSFADLFFLVFLFLLTFTPLSAGLLGDADTGWHIRTGEMILATARVPRTDSFSYTMPGKPWFAWEWLYDVAIASAHHVAGLNGVVLVTAAVISVTFAMLFHFLLKRGGNLAVAAVLTLLAAAAAQVHMLARPHVFSWLLTLLWVECLLRFTEGRRRWIAALPLLMLVWVNLHGGWILGLVLLPLFAVEPAFRRNRRAVVQLAAIFLLCTAVSLFNPYGCHLPVHVYQYLSDGFLMNSIDEFQSPDFHQPVYLYFAALFPLSVLAGIVGKSRLTITDCLLWSFAVYSGLYAARNVPIAAILLSMVIGPLLAALPWQSCSCLSAVEEISQSMSLLDRRLRGHAVAIVFIAACAGVALHGGRLFSRQWLNARFNEKAYPVQAAAFLASHRIRDHLFSTDSWGAYLIYRLYPATKVHFDDRHDFYGEAFVKEYGATVSASRTWQDPLDRHHVKWVLMPVNAPLSTLLRENSAWQVLYDDGVAVLFARKPL